MYTVVMMAALTTGIDMPDRGGRRGGGCCGCYGGGGYGMGMGMGYGGCYGMGMGMGYGGCYGVGMGMGYGGGYGGGWGRGYGMGYGGGYGGYTLGAYSPNLGGYAYSPMMNSWGWGWGNSLASGGAYLNSGGAYLNSGMTRSFYGNSAAANEATIVVHLPADASLSIDGQQTQQRSGTRTFTSPPLQPGRTYTYTLRAERDRDGHLIRDTKTVEVRAGERSEVTLNFGNTNRDEEGNGRRGPVEETPPPGLQRPPNP